MYATFCLLMEKDKRIEFVVYRKKKAFPGQTQGPSAVKLSDKPVMLHAFQAEQICQRDVSQNK